MLKLRSSVILAKVTLLAYTKEPEILISAAAKLCYSEVEIADIFEGLTEDKSKAFINMLMDLGHQSPLEHVNFTFGLEEISRSLLAQITRHRIASYSVQSQRYVKENNFSFVIPPSVASDHDAKEEFLTSMDEDIKHYNNLVNILKNKYKKELKGFLNDEKLIERNAEKKAIEDARFVLPNACATKMICTFNARSLINFFKLRCCNRAQWEIREVATEMLRLCKNVAPEIFKSAGPSCVSGVCSEGKMTCKNATDVRKKFLSLR